MTDRNAQYPGRVKLTPVSGQANTYDMELADSPRQVGTPLNKATFLPDSVANYIGGLGTNPLPGAALKRVHELALSGETGTYTGTGTYGANNKNSLTFSINPIIVFIQEAGGSNHMPYIWGNTGFNFEGGGNTRNNVVSVSGKTMRWYNGASSGTARATWQANANGVTYRWVAIGFRDA